MLWQSAATFVISGIDLWAHSQWKGLCIVSH